MLLFLKSIIVGLGKVIPGVSGALLAINFGIYEKFLDSITSFFNDWKKNIKFLFIFCCGIIIAIIFGSKIILYFLINYKFITMLFFIGLVLGGTYNFSKNINYNYKNIILVLFIVCLITILGINNFNNDYIIKNNYLDNIIFFLGGFIDIFASIVPGISGTSLLMMMGIYENVLNMISMIFDYNYVLNNINIYISYGIGMFLSFIINSYLINYLIKKYKNISYSVILGLAISSIILLLVMCFKISFSFINLIIGLIFFFIGIFISKKMSN